MSFKKEYYEEKLVGLNKRLQTKRADIISEIVNALQRYLSDEKGIIDDSHDIQKIINENRVLLDKDEKPINADSEAEEEVKVKVEEKPKEEPKK